MRKIIYTVALLFFIVFNCKAQTKKVADHSAADSVYFSKVKYRLVGPFRGGRSGAVAGSYKNKSTFYFGATGGGVWKSIDAGANWKNISDKYFGGTIGSVAVAPSDESVIYVGEGENTLRGNVSEGLDGIWRSGDGGRTWNNIGLKDCRHIVRIVIDPQNPNVVWVAAMGHLFGPNAERGIFKTTDGGKTWKKVLFVNNDTGCSDLTMEPGNPQVLYAGMWHVRRTPYSMESGGEGSGLYKSTDGGETWKNLSNKKGLPTGVWGIVSVAVAPSNTDKIYTMIENAKGGLFMSEDAGETWTLASSDNEIKQRAWYYDKVFVDPKNEDIVYCPNVQLMRSADGGKTFKSLPSPHSDHHDLWIDPEDSKRMILADDGGAQVSLDGANSWSTVMSQPTAQIYRVTTDNAFPYRILGAQQDNSALRIKSHTDSPQGITADDFENTAGAESGYIVADPLNPDIVYGGNYDGYLSRLDHKTGENRAINVWPDNPMGSGADLLKYRFQWNFPIFFSPNNPKRLYTAGNHLFVTENEGQTWEMISPDLTTNEKAKQASSGGQITQDNTSVEYYCTIFTATESALEKDLLWTGSDDGVISVSRDAGKNWKTVTPPAAGKYMMWNCVETDPFKQGTAYFVGTKYKLDDFTPYIYKTEDYGATWKVITNGIGKMDFARTLRADHKRPGLLYAGTEYGMYISYDSGANWKKFRLNLPLVPITDLTIKNNDLIVATQGRAFYVIDDLSMVQQKSDALPANNLTVFTVNDAYRTPGGGRRGRRGGKVVLTNAGANPPAGVVFNYYLKGATDSSKVSVTIFDKQQKPIKTFSRKAKEVGDKLDFTNGMNQFVWDMQFPAPESTEGFILWNGGVGALKAGPGKYKARFRYEKDSVDVPFTILPNPNFKMPEADYDKQIGFLIQVRDKFNEVQKTIKDIRSLRTQINDFTGRLSKPDAKVIKPVADSIVKKLTDIEEKLYQTKSKSGEDPLNFPIRLNDKLAGLYGVASSGENLPSKQVQEAFSELGGQSDVQISRFKKIVSTDLPVLNKLIIEKQTPVISIKN
jgi:photosystem II stability/assembly factor-like uncharacterized protein